LGPGWEIRLSINGKLEVMTITGKPKLQEVAQAIEATAKHTAEAALKVQVQQFSKGNCSCKQLINISSLRKEL